MEAGPSQQEDVTNLTFRVKRKRVTLACQRCRVKKAKCNGSKPTCSNCENADERCEWPDPDKDGRKNKSRKVASEASAERRKESPVDGSISVLQNVYASPPLYDRYGPLATSIQRFYDAHQNACDPFVSEEARTHVNSSIPSPGRSTRSQQSPPNHITPRDASSPMNSSPIDILLAAAALPLNPPATRNLPGAEDNSESSARSYSPEIPRRLPYFRPLGPTAAEPVLERIRINFNGAAMDVRQGPSVIASRDLASPQYEDSHFLAPFTFELNRDVPRHTHNTRLLSPQESLYAPGSNIPRIQYLQKLIPLFFSRMGCHFPFLTEKLLVSPINADNPSKQMTIPLLVNTVCALAARFSDSPFLDTASENDRPATYGMPFADRAKQLLIPLLGYPSPTIIAALIFLAYFSFGLNDDGATWMYSGMALRMAVDLGLHQETNGTSDSAADEIGRSKSRLLWWSCFVLDRTVAFLMGRPTSLKDEEIKVSLPNDADINTVTNGELHHSSPAQVSFPFVYHVKMFQLYGILAELVNTRNSCSPSSRTGLSSSDTDGETLRRLTGLEQSIMTAYDSLPRDMVFSPTNLKAHAASSGPVFLALHLWYHAIIILLYRVPLIHKHVIAARASLADRLAVVNNSSLAIRNILGSAELMDPSVLAALPFVSQCFFITAIASIQGCRIREGQSVLASLSTSASSSARSESVNNSRLLHSSTGVLGQMAMNDYKLCKSALARQAPYWLGVQRMEAAVEQYASQTRRLNLKGDLEGVDVFMLKSETVSFGRLLQRLTGSSVFSEIHRHILDQLFAAASADANGPDSSPHRLSVDDGAFICYFASFQSISDQSRPIVVIV